MAKEEKQGEKKSVHVIVKRSLNDAMALSNRVYLNVSDYTALFGAGANRTNHWVAIDNGQPFCYVAETSKDAEAGCILMNNCQRTDNVLAKNDTVTLRPCPDTTPIPCISVTMDVALTKIPHTIVKVQYKALVDAFRIHYWQPLSLGQRLQFSLTSNTHIWCTVTDIQVLPDGATQPQPLAPESHAMIAPVTTLQFNVFRGERLRIEGNVSGRDATNLIRRDWSFEQMGVGGLDRQFADIFRRAFASRVYPPSFIAKMGIRHVKGILLFGPPGTGKTLLARQIARMLNAKEPKIVNGPEVLNKYVGQSEENVRRLFSDAEREQTERGEDSDLHVLIFDEIDAICAQRGTHVGGSGVADTVVNQLLSKMDGVNQLNNMLIIGMTNRLDMIDEALLRPGRFEMHVEIGLPDEAGRLQIFKIHTASMAKNGILSADVDLAKLAHITRNFSGAEIEGLIRAASAFAMDRHINMADLKSVSKELESTVVCAADFNAALGECKAAYGVADDEINAHRFANGIIRFCPQVETITARLGVLLTQALNSTRTSLQCVLLYGCPGCGKTALACETALVSTFPMIRMLSAETLNGYTEAGKCACIRKMFADTDRSPAAFLVIDDIERILEYVSVGPRFSNAVLQTLSVLLRKTPTPGHRLFLLCTTSDALLLNELGLTECFDERLYLPTVSTAADLNAVIEAIEPTLPRVDADLAVLSTGIKRVITRIERYAQEPAEAASIFMMV